MIRYCLFAVLLFVAVSALAQTPLADFVVDPSVCLEQNINVVNNSLNADLFEWDFCLGDFNNLVSNQDLATITGLSNGFGYKIIEDDGLWYGFAVSQSTHSIIRLDFGNSPNNNPSVVNLGNPGDLLLFPQGIDLYKDNGTWYAFVGFNNNNYGLVRLDFGNKLTNTPSGLNIGNFGVTGRFWDLRIIKQGTDLILVIVERNTGSIVRVNYRDSFLNTIDIPTHVFNTGAIPGAGLTPGMDVAKKGSDWFVFITSSSNTFFQISFGVNILGTATVDASYGFPGITNPLRIKIAQEGDNYYAVVTNLTSPIDVIDLKDLNIANVPVELSFASLPQLLSIDVIRYKGQSVVQGIGNLNNKLRQLLFEATCGANLDFSELTNPYPISYNTAGVKKIELKVTNTTSLEQSIAARQVTVSALTAPDIIFTSQNVCANNDINFTSQNISADITDYNWDFGDTNTSIAQDPTHQYTVASDYIVSLQVTASNGCNNQTRDTITIFNQPVANFNLPSASPICTNQQYLFTNTSSFDAGSNPSWSWEVNGNPASTDQDLNYVIPSVIMQDVKLIASIPGCSNEIMRTINTVEEGPLADFTFENGCEDTSIDFTNTTSGSVTGYSWNFGEGSSSLQTDPSNTFVDFGNFDVTLQAINAAGCVNSVIKPIQIFSKPQPDFSLDLPPFSCSGSPSQFNDLTPNPTDSNLSGWDWTFNDPQNGTSTNRNPQYTYAFAGSYDVNLEVTTNFGCKASIQKQITISQSPDTDFSFSPACVNQATQFTGLSSAEITSWQWNIGTSSYMTQNPIHVFGAPSSFNATVTANGSNGCITTVVKSIDVPVASSVDFLSENNCAEQATIFTDNTEVGADQPVTWNWQFGSEGTSSGPSSQFSFTKPGVYPSQLSITYQSGCTYSVVKNVTIIDSPTANFSATPENGTPPLEVNMINQSVNSVSQIWQVNDGNNSTTSELSPSFTFEELGEFVVDLTVFNSEGCFDSFSKIVSVIVPSLDVELTELTLAKANSGEVSLQISVKNKSNFSVSNLKASINVSGETLLSEVMPTTILPGSVYTQVLNTKIVAARNNLSFVCVELVADGDINISDNQKCENLESEIVVFDPYPNPGVNELSLDWVASASGNADVYIFNSSGQKVFDNTVVDFSIGLNHLIVQVPNLNPGIYFVLFVAEGIRKNFPVVISK